MKPTLIHKEVFALLQRAVFPDVPAGHVVRVINSYHQLIIEPPDIPPPDEEPDQPSTGH